MAVVLGASAAGGTLWFAVADDGSLTSCDPIRFDLATGIAHAAALQAGQQELGSMLKRLKVDSVVLAEGEANAQLSYKGALPRFTVELVLEFAAAEANVPLERVSRAKLRGAHKLPRTGSLSSHAGTVVSTPLAPHWKNRRDIAALAALASAAAGPA